MVHFHLLQSHLLELCTLDNRRNLVTHNSSVETRSRDLHTASLAMLVVASRASHFHQQATLGKDNADFQL
jgi:hypothetical protein